MVEKKKKSKPKKKTKSKQTPKIVVNVTIEKDKKGKTKAPRMRKGKTAKIPTTSLVPSFQQPIQPYPTTIMTVPTPTSDKALLEFETKLQSLFKELKLPAETPRAIIGDFNAPPRPPLPAPELQEIPIQEIPMRGAVVEPKIEMMRGRPRKEITQSQINAMMSDELLEKIRERGVEPDPAEIRNKSGKLIRSALIAILKKLL